MRGVGTAEPRTRRDRSAARDAFALPPARPGAGTVHAVSDADGYRSSVRGVTVDTIRTGAGEGPNLVRATRATSLTATNVDIQFPILSRAAIPENRLTVSAMISTPPSNSWCGIDLEPGLVVIYGPGVEHTAVNPVGTRFVFAAVDLSALQRLAASLRFDLDPPRRGEVALLLPAPETEAFTDCLRRLFRTDESRVKARWVVESDLLYAIVRCLGSSRRMQRGNRVNSRRVTLDCIDYAETTGRIPSVEEMCMTSHVSERRLRIAFAESYGMPPTQVLRMWAMAKASEQFRAVDASPGIVSRVAMDLGFTHLGRFAARYRAIYGEPPSHAVRNGKSLGTVRAASG